MRWLTKHKIENIIIYDALTKQKNNIKNNAKNNAQAFGH